MSNALLKALSTLKSTQELSGYIEDILECNKPPQWSVNASLLLENWVTKIIEDGNVLCAVSITRLLLKYISSFEESEIPNIFNVYMKLNNLVDISTKWDSVDSFQKIAFWESVNELHMMLCITFPASVNKYLITFGSVLFNSCIDEELSLFLRQLRVKALNVSLENSSHDLRNEFRASKSDCIEKVLAALEKGGDYDFQTSLIEMVFRLTTSSERSHFVRHCFPNLESSIQQLFIKIKDFDPDCRRFLNAYNAELGTRRTVFSYAASKAQIGNFFLHKPNVSTYEQLWIDFNLGSGTISILFDRSESDVERSWETIIIYSHEVEKVKLTKENPHILVVELGRDPIDFFATPPSQESCKLLDTIFKIEFATIIPNLENLCHLLYDNKLKIEEKTRFKGKIKETDTPSSNEKQSASVFSVCITTPSHNFSPINDVISVSSNICTPTVNKRHVPNVNLSSGTTSIYPSTPQWNGQPNSSKPLQMSKLKQVLNNKESPKKIVKSRKKSKTCEAVQAISGDSNTPRHHIVSRPEIINKTNEIEIIDITPEDDDDEEVIPSSITKREGGCSLLHVSGKTSSTDSDDIIPSSVTKSTDSIVINISKPDVLARKSLLKGLESPGLVVYKETKIDELSNGSDSIEAEKNTPRKSKPNKISDSHDVISLNKQIIQSTEFKVNNETTNSSSTVDFCNFSNKSDIENSKDTEFESSNKREQEDAVSLNTIKGDVGTDCEVITETPENESHNDYNAGKTLKAIDPVDIKSNNSFSLNENFDSQKDEGESIIMLQNLDEISFTEELVKDKLDNHYMKPLDVSATDFQDQYSPSHNVSDNNTNPHINDFEGDVKIEIFENTSPFTSKKTSVNFSNMECNSDEKRVGIDNSAANNAIENDKSVECVYVNSNNFKLKSDIILESHSSFTSESENISERTNKNVILDEQKEDQRSLKVCQLQNNKASNELHIEETNKDESNNNNIRGKDMDSGVVYDGVHYFTTETVNDNLISDSTIPMVLEIHLENKANAVTVNETSSNEKFEEKQVYDKDLDLNREKSICSEITPNKITTAEDNQFSRNSHVTPTSLDSSKVEESVAVSSTAKISEYSVITPLSENAIGNSCKTPSKRNSNHRKNNTPLPDHYTPNLSHIDKNKTQGSSCKSKKKLFSVQTANILEGSPPEYNESIQVSKLESSETAKSISRDEKLNLSETAIQNDTSLIKSQNYHIFKSKQRQLGGDDHSLSASSNEKEKVKNGRNNMERVSKRSLFSEIEFSDASDSDLWLHKNSTKKSSIKTYRRKPMKRRHQETSDSDEWNVGREKKRNKRHHIRDRKRVASSKNEIKLFESPKYEKESSRGRRTIITRSMTGKLGRRGGESLVQEHGKRKYSTYVQSLASSTSSSDVMRNTSLSQSENSINNALQISEVNITKPKNSKKSDVGNVFKKIKSTDETYITELEQYELVKEVLIDNLPSNLHNQNSENFQNLHPNPPNNTPVYDSENLDFSNSNAPLCEKNFGPQSTSSPKIAFVGELGHSYINSSDGLVRDNSKNCENSPTNLIKSKLNFERSSKDSGENIVYDNSYGNENMILIHPNSTPSSSDELESVKDPKNRKKILYIKRKAVNGNNRQVVNEEIHLSPLVPPSFDKFFSSQQSDAASSLPLALRKNLDTNSQNTNSGSFNENVNKNVCEVSNVQERTNSGSVAQVSNSLQYKETPRTGVSKNVCQTPTKPVPRSLFENIKYASCLAREEAKSVAPTVCSTSSSSRRDNESEVHENGSAMDSVRLPRSTLKLLLEEIRTMGEASTQLSRKCTIVHDVLKDIIQSVDS